MSLDRSEVRRLDRIAAIRETMASAAEARLRDAELQVRQIQLQDQQIVRQIDSIRAEISQRQRLTGHRVQQNEKYLYRLNKHREALLQALETARKIVVERQQQWIEARRDQRIIDRLQEKRLLQWRRQQDVLRQKAADDSFIGKLAREKSQE